MTKEQVKAGIKGYAEHWYSNLAPQYKNKEDKKALLNAFEWCFNRGEESQLKPQGEKEKRRPCTCHLKPYSEFTPLEKEYGCYNCSRKPTPPKG